MSEGKDLLAQALQEMEVEDSAWGEKDTGEERTQFQLWWRL